MCRLSPILCMIAAAMLLLPCASSYKLLFFPLSERTHMIVHLKLATELALRNNTVYFMTADCHQQFAEKTASKMAPTASLHFIPYWMNCTYHEEEKAKARKLNPLSEAKAILGNVIGRIDDVLSNSSLLADLEQLAPQLDLMVNDILSYGMLISSKLGVQYVDLDVGTAGALWEPIFYGADPSTSFIPAVGTFFPTNGMSFWQRVINLPLTKLTRAALNYAYWAPGGWLQALVRKHKLPLRWPYVHYMMLLTNSNFITEPPRAIAPNTKYIGPILPEPAQQLPADLAEFVEGSGSIGTVLISFGGTLQAPLAASQTLVKVMRSMPDVRFVWKLAKEDQEAISTNTADLSNAYISDWVPQNDLLGHPKLRAFVTQGGYLSMAEAAYHAVPVLGMPFIPGQGELIRFAQDQGRAVRIPANTLVSGKVETFRQSLLDVLTNDKYRQAAAVASKRLQAVGRPYKQQAADWVEYAAAVKDHGPFLNPQKLKQWWYQQVMLDVLLFYAALLAVPVVCMWNWLQCLRWRLATQLPPVGPSVFAEVSLLPGQKGKTA